jgi:hypothetical protein
VLNGEDIGKVVGEDTAKCDGDVTGNVTGFDSGVVTGVRSGDRLKHGDVDASSKLSGAGYGYKHTSESDSSVLLV